MTLGALRAHDGLIRRLHAEAGAARWGLTLERLSEALAAGVERRFHPAPVGAVPPREVAAHLESLHVADLALACACADGSAEAWDALMSAERPGLYAAARAIAGERGRELADALWADLYGTETRAGRRRALLDHFHGRSKLSTWLRAVLARRHVDQVRADRRVRSLDDDEAGTPDAATLAAPDPPASPDRLRLTRLFREAMAAAVAALAPGARLRLSYYYLHDLTLAQIGRLVGEHESSVSRKLERARRALRQDIVRRLGEQGLREADVRQCYEWEMDQGQAQDLLRRSFQEEKSLP